MYLYGIDFLRIFIQNGNGNPLPTLRSPDTIPILPLIFFVLDVIQYHKYIGTVELIKVTDPRQILRLMYCYNH